MAAARPTAPEMLGVPASNFARQIVVGRLLERDGQDHVAAALPRRHGLQAAPHGRTGRRCQWAVELVAREGVEVAAQGADIDVRVRNGLRAIDEHDRALRVRGLDDPLHRQDGAQRIRDMGDCDELRARRQQLHELVEQQLAALVDRRHLQRAAGLLAHHLPRDDVGVVLERGDRGSRRPALKRGRAYDCATRLIASVVPRTKMISLRRTRIDESPHALARTLKRFRRRLAQCVHAAMDVRV